MEWGFKIEAALNSILDEQGIVDLDEREQMKKYSLTRYLMGSMSNEEECKYWKLINEVNGCIKKSTKGVKLVSELLLMIAEKVFDSHMNE